MSPSLVSESAASSAGNGTKSAFETMNTSMVESRFLSNPGHLGVVAVGFSGGQVCRHPNSLSHIVSAATVLQRIYLCAELPAYVIPTCEHGQLSRHS